MREHFRYERNLYQIVRLLLGLVALVPGGCAVQRSASQLGTASNGTASNDTGLRREIERVNREMEAAFERGDLLAVARVYADDGCIVGGRSRSRTCGRDAIDRYWTTITAPKSWRLEVLEVGGGRTEAFQVGRSTLITGTASDLKTTVVDFVVIWKREESGRWRIHLDTY
jgi:uncharacterized protein (TIGR02246 family)